MCHLQESERQEINFCNINIQSHEEIRQHNFTRKLDVKHWKQ